VSVGLDKPLLANRSGGTCTIMAKVTTVEEQSGQLTLHVVRRRRLEASVEYNAATGSVWFFQRCVDASRPSSSKVLSYSHGSLVAGEKQ
jgi:hypothetical protein